MLGMIIGLAAVLFVALPVVLVIGGMILAVLSGTAVLFAAGAFAGKGILAGIVIGYVLYRTARKNRNEREAE